MSIVVVLYIIVALRFLIANGREADAVWHVEKLQPVGQKPINPIFYDTYLKSYNAAIFFFGNCIAIVTSDQSNYWIFFIIIINHFLGYQGFYLLVAH